MKEKGNGYDDGEGDGAESEGVEGSISEGGGAAEGGADFFEKLKKHVKRKIKPYGSFGEESARLFEKFL